ncbi:MAG: SRPBCC family protein [Pseudonocardiaceae bacterium]
MELTHQFTIPAPVDTVWEAVLDLERVVPCMPGATLTSVSGDEFAGTVKVRLGPISLQYKGSGRFTETDASAHRAVIEASGKDNRGNGTAAATVTASLAGNGAGTEVTVVTDLSVTGKPAQFGRGLLADVSGKLIGQFADCLAGKLGSAEGPGVDAEPQPAAPALAPPAAAQQGPVERPSGTSGPVRPTPRPVSEEIDLLDTAGRPVLERIAPAAAGLVVLLLVIRWLRRRRR